MTLYILTIVMQLSVLLIVMTQSSLPVLKKHIPKVLQNFSKRLLSEFNQYYMRSYI